MNKQSLIIVIVVVAALVALGLAHRGEGSAVSRWFASLHGAPSR